MKNITSITVDRSVALPDPARLSAQAATAADQILAAAHSANTTRSYRTALRYWAGWYQGRYAQPLRLPLPSATVVQFIVDHVARDTAEGVRWELPAALDQALVAAKLKSRPGPWRLATLTHRVSVLSKVHQLQHLANPLDSVEVRQLLVSARRTAHKRGERPRKKAAITLGRPARSRPALLRLFHWRSPSQRGGGSDPGASACPARRRFCLPPGPG